MANPQDDYKIWLVLNPSTFLPVIWIAALVIAVLIHGLVLTHPRYSHMSIAEKAYGSK